MMLRFLGDKMKKVNLSISLITQSEHEEYNLTGEIDEKFNRLTYVEPSTNIHIVIDKSAKQMIRESDHYRMVLYFKEDERIEILLKEEAAISHSYFRRCSVNITKFHRFILL